MKLKFYKSPYTIWLALAGLAVLAFIPQMALAWDTDILTGILGTILFYIFVGPLALLLELELLVLIPIASYNNFTRQAGVVQGWTVLRDLSNMFFIVVLLVIAFATILRIQGYGYKQLLSRLLITAILINFSMTLVGLAIDFSQVVMLTFVSAIQNVASGNIIVSLGLSHVLSLKGDVGAVSYVDFLGSLILGVIMLLIAVVVVMVFILMLGMRIVKLWILVILSPIAFLFRIFPKTEQYFSKWVEDLSKNLISGPTLVFFLWLAFTITGRGDIYESFKGLEQSGGSGVSEATSPVNVLNFIIAIALLVGGLQMTAQTGGTGAGLAGLAKGGFGKGLNKVRSKLGQRVWQGKESKGGAGGIKGGLTALQGKAGAGLVRLADATRTVKLRGKEIKIPVVSNKLEKAGMRAQARASIYKDKRTEGAATETAGMTQEEKEKYYTLGSRKIFASFRTSAEGRNLVRHKMETGRYNKDNVKELQDDAAFLEKEGGAKEKDLIKTMKRKYSVLADPQTIQEEINKTNVKEAAMALKMDIAVKTDPNGQVTVDDKAKEVVKLLMEQSPRKVIEDIYASKSKEERDAFLEIIRSIQTTDNMFNPDGSLDKNSMTYKRNSALVYGDAKYAEEVYQGIQGQDAAETHQMRQTFSKERIKHTDMNEVKKMKPDALALKYLGAEMNESQLMQMAGLKSADRDYITTLKNAQISSGRNLSAMANSNVMGNYITNEDARKSMRITIDAADSAEKEKTVERIVKANLIFGSEAFKNNAGQLDRQKFAKFINEKLSVDQIAQLNKKDVLDIFGDLSNDIQTALKEQEGISP